MRIIDTHCHLTDPRLLGQIDAVIERARAAGVGPVIAIGCGPEDAANAVELTQRFSDVWAAVAVHPHKADTFNAESRAAIKRLLGLPKVVAVGEIGLDYHYDFAPRDAQRETFREQLRLAAELDKPVVIHSREAVADTLAIIEEARRGGVRVRGVFHSFTGDADEARSVLAAGFLISLSGVVTFRKADDLREAARLIPPDRLLIETDAPYLSPEPVRRIKTNEPALIVHTLRKLAQLRGVDEAELSEQANRNAQRLFRLTTA